MSVRQTLVVAVLGWAAARAQSPQEAVRRAMESATARQAAAVATMRISIARQRAAVAAAQSENHPAHPEPFFTLSWPAISMACDPLTEQELSPLIQQAAQKEGVEPGLLRAVAEEESGFRACAVSPKGAMGLMQLMPATASELGVRDPFDPQESLVFGARFLKQLLARFGGDASLALAAYNAGPGRVEESGGVPDIPETIRYVEQIMDRVRLP